MNYTTKMAGRKFNDGIERGDQMWVSDKYSNFYRHKVSVFDFNYKKKLIICNADGDMPGLAFQRRELTKIYESDIESEVS